ncbi:hypothetical protein [Amycolatopsis dendrobii]|uniref:hypothetical protein n=1 Tax=Amycolatopsis dendrobii TaxID=2760662 RepID=UPI001FE26DD0|nr:hypothetical protein [Amycolatopsis dendrobii]
MRGNSSEGRKRFACTQLFWLGPGEVVAADLARTGSVSAGTAVLGLTVVLAGLVSPARVRAGVRAAADLVARLVFLPPHGWSAFVVVLDLAVACFAWFTAGRDGGRR